MNYNLTLSFSVESCVLTYKLIRMQIPENCNFLKITCWHHVCNCIQNSVTLLKKLLWNIYYVSMVVSVLILHHI
jgi:hypothetical protein